MGMSSDYLIAIESGSTMVRIGSLIFGEQIDFRNTRLDVKLINFALDKSKNMAELNAEEKSLNFLEEIIEDDLKAANINPFSPVSTRTQWISAYRSCQIHLPQLRTGNEIWRKNQSSF